jgi:hypothetical protein
MIHSTRFLARLIGIFALVLAVTMFARGGAAAETMLADASAVLILAMITVAAGLALVLAHNVWSGGLLPLVVTLVGWLMLTKGTVLLFLTPATLQRIFGLAHYPEYFYAYLLPALLIGLYLTWAGFSTPSQPNLRSAA